MRMFSVLMAALVMSVSHVAGAQVLERDNISELTTENGAASRLHEHGYDGKYICQNYVNVRGPIAPGGYAGAVIGTAYYGERVVILGQSYIASTGYGRETFVRVRFESDGAYGYVAYQFICG